MDNLQWSGSANRTNISSSPVPVGCVRGSGFSALGRPMNMPDPEYSPTTFQYASTPKPQRHVAPDAIVLGRSFPAQEHSRYRPDLFEYRGRTYARYLTTNDFIRPNHPLPIPSLRLYPSDQDLPIIEPESFFPSIMGIIDPSVSHSVQDQNAAHITQECQTSRQILAVRVPTLTEEKSSVRSTSTASDTFSPVFGGLHKISDVRRKPSKRDRVKQDWQKIKRRLSSRSYRSSEHGSGNYID